MTDTATIRIPGPKSRPAEQGEGLPPHIWRPEDLYSLTEAGEAVIPTPAGKKLLVRYGSPPFEQYRIGNVGGFTPAHACAVLFEFHARLPE